MLMSAIKEKRTAIWQILFSYLVVSKVIYYFEFIATALNQGGLWAMREALLTRLFTQDMLIIIIILLTFNTEKFVASKITKYNKAVNQVIVHIIDYVLYMGVLVIYFWVMMFFDLSQNMSWRGIFFSSSIVYLVIIIAIETKKYLKKKEMTGYTHILSADEKLAMLKTLLDNSVLTQDEYDSKKETLLDV